MATEFLHSWDFKRADCGVLKDSTGALIRAEGKGVLYELEHLKVQAEPDPKGLKPIRLIASTANIDRYKDTIAVEGWNLVNFSRNAVGPWCHNTGEPPVLRYTNWDTEEALVLEGLETPRDLYAFGYMIGQMIRAGFINAFSVGFIPLEYEYSDDEARESNWGMPGVDFLSTELTECSPCVVPANPDCLYDPKSFGAPFLAAKARGLDVLPAREMIVKSLDGLPGLWIPKHAAELAYRELGFGQTISIPEPRAMADRKTFVLVVECAAEHEAKVCDLLVKKALNNGATCQVRDAAEGEGDMTSKALVKELTALCKDFGGHAKDFAAHSKDFEGHGKTLTQGNNDLAKCVKDMKAALPPPAAPADPDKTAPASVTKGGATHKMSKAVEAEHATATKALKAMKDLSDGAEPEKPANPPSDDDAKALAQLTALNKANAQILQTLTGRVAPT